LFERSAIRKPPPGIELTPVGWFSRALVAGPPSPAKPPVPATPATVVIVPSTCTSRTTLLASSAISTPPSGAATARIGAASSALVAGPPSPANPDCPVPAIVVIVPLPACAAVATSSTIAAATAPRFGDVSKDNNPNIFIRRKVRSSICRSRPRRDARLRNPLGALSFLAHPVRGDMGEQR
jgi:hypothetical protein